MKKQYLIIVLVLILGGNAAISQEILDVESGVGTLNTAVTENGGAVIYRLAAGEFYILNAPLENVDYHLHIIGEEPEEGGLPATLQTGSNVDGAAIGTMFLNKGDITLENIYIMNVDVSKQTGGIVIESFNTGATIIVDRCVVDPVGLNHAIRVTGGEESITWTNNLALRHGHQESPNDGHFFSSGGSITGKGLKMLLVENNTFVGTGTSMFESGFNARVHEYVNWNHNTWINQKSQLDWSTYEEEYYFTNNLMYNVNTQVWSVTWQPMPGADAGYPQPALIYADTIPDDVMPSSTVQYIQYNAHTRASGFYDLLAELNEKATEDEKPPVYYMDLIWTGDAPEVAESRESMLFNGPGLEGNDNFPNWQFGNYIKGEDPGWVDQRIYASSDDFIEWTRPASLIHALVYPSDAYPPSSEWNRWHWDPDGDISLNDTWPVFNGQYTNETLLNSSIAMNVPIGDLNWWPEAKAAWEESKNDIDAHIAAGSTTQLDIGFDGVDVPCVGAECDVVLGEQIRKNPDMLVYPNPASDMLYIDSKIQHLTIQVRDVNGKTLKTVNNTNSINISDLRNGIYFISISEGKNRYTKKLIIDHK